jgi:hypothetical protein
VRKRDGSYSEDGLGQDRVRRWPQLSHTVSCVPLFLDGDASVERKKCSDCGAEYLLVKSFVLDAEGPAAIAFAALHHHGVAEAWMDVIFGCFEGDVTDDRYTFGCRVGPVDGSPEPAATAVNAAVPYEDSATFGHKLARDEALAHPRVRDFWDVVDYLLVTDPTINHHVYGHLPAKRRRLVNRWLRK